MTRCHRTSLLLIGAALAGGCSGNEDPAPREAAAPAAIEADSSAAAHVHQDSTALQGNAAPGTMDHSGMEHAGTTAPGDADAGAHAAHSAPGGAPAAPRNAAADHGAHSPPARAAAQPADHAAHAPAVPGVTGSVDPAAHAPAAGSAVDVAATERLKRLATALLEDPQVRARVERDTALRRLLQESAVRQPLRRNER